MPANLLKFFKRGVCFLKIILLTIGDYFLADFRLLISSLILDAFS